MTPGAKMNHTDWQDPSGWYEAIPFADGITLIHEPWLQPFYRCNMWHLAGRDRDILVDTGLGALSLTGALPVLLKRPIVNVSSHCHFDHIGSTHEFAERLVHSAEAEILADPRPEWTLVDKYIADRSRWDSMFIEERPLPVGPSTYRIRPAPATGLLADGDVIDQGDRHWRVIHTPGHSPGGIALLEEKTGTMIAGDIVYDGELVTETFHSNLDDYRASMAMLRNVPVRIVHAGHGNSYGQVRQTQLIDAFFRQFG
jgi:glyoxylase-like metal-dependent hydrolase (beta-lactamase superfamily II)